MCRKIHYSEEERYSKQIEKDKEKYKIKGEKNMVRDLMKTNCYDVGKTMIIVGSCLERMQKEFPFHSDHKRYDRR